jgi:hypothetical protein
MIESSHDESNDSCPLPPDGFQTAPIPVISIDVEMTPLLRIHWKTRDPIYFNRRSTSSTIYRFDAPNNEYGVLYASPSFDACMAETLMRGRFRGINAGAPRLIEERAILERSVATVEPQTGRVLQLADLTQPLWHLGFDTQVLSTPHYAGPNRWSAAFHENVSLVDGLYSRSRFGNAASVALFSDRINMVHRAKSIPLINYPGLADFLDRFDIGIADLDGVRWRGPHE